MMVSKKQFHNLVRTYWRPTAFYGGLLILFGGLLWYRLGTLVGYSADELATMHASTSFRHILDNPINAPYLILGRAFLYIADQSLLLMRFVTGLFALGILSTFYWLVRHWHGERSAVFGTIMFGSSAWFLHTTRLGTPEVLLFLTLALAACAVWLKRTDNRFALVAGFALAVSLLYVPGAIWLLLVGVVWQAKTIIKLFKEHLPLMLASSLGALTLLAPLGWAIYNNSRIAKLALGLPATGWPQPLDALQRLAAIPYNLALRGPLDPEHWLGRLPVLDAFSAVMLLFGIYLYVQHHKLVRSRLMAAALIISSLLIALGGAVNLTMLMPFLYILIAAGIGFMLDRWYAVFPRNVIAQGVGVLLIALAITASCWYGVRHYFIAWPSAPATKNVFSIEP
jgi:hypothetical protein